MMIIIIVAVIMIMEIIVGETIIVVIIMIIVIIRPCGSLRGTSGGPPPWPRWRGGTPGPLSVASLLVHNV